VLVQVPRFSKFLHGMALLHPQRCSESPRWFVWDEASGCAVPAGLEEMRGISEERITMKQQVGVIEPCSLCGYACMLHVPEVNVVLHVVVHPEASGCAVPARMEEMRGITEERINMK
jgi:hypothetical protein